MLDKATQLTFTLIPALRGLMMDTPLVVEFLNNPLMNALAENGRRDKEGERKAEPEFHQESVRNYAEDAVARLKDPEAMALVDKVRSSFGPELAATEGFTRSLLFLIRRACTELPDDYSHLSEGAKYALLSAFQVHRLVEHFQRRGSLS